MRVIPKAEQRIVPWKNGRGTTREVIVLGGDPFTARMSVAAVTEDGPFSAFPGVDRFLAIREGAGLDLEIDGVAVALQPEAILAFDGAATTMGRLRDGPVRDLNWMVRRPARGSAWLGEVESVSGPAVVLVLEGALGGPSASLGPDDAALLEAGEHLTGRARVFLARLE